VFRVVPRRLLHMDEPYIRKNRNALPL
jgi:hypothetical protein